MAGQKTSSAPLSDVIITALSRLIDDSQTETREPSHSDLDYLVARCDLSEGDPKSQGQAVGKAKRARATLNWALEHNYQAGELLVGGLVAQVRGCGGFRPTSPNFVGTENIGDLREAFLAEGYELSEAGELSPLILDSLSGADLTDALRAYVRRAKRGVGDAALVTGTEKDLLEATAGHILVERFGVYSKHTNFPTLLGQAYAALGLPTTHDPEHPGEVPQRKLSRALFQAACAVNVLRNKDGTGHGRPWLPGVTAEESCVAVEVMGVVASFLLMAHEANP